MAALSTSPESRRCRTAIASAVHQPFQALFSASSPELFSRVFQSFLHLATSHDFDCDFEHDFDLDFADEISHPEHGFGR